MSNRDEIIYFVTVFYLDEKYREDKSFMPKDDDKWESYLYKRIRCWGWFKDEKDAERCIMENWTDIYENGYYNLAIIEPHKQGPIGLVHRKDRWFDIGYIDGHTYNIKEIQKPARFGNIVGFSYA